MRQKGLHRLPLQNVPWRNIGIAAATFVLLMAFVAPFRSAVASAGSRVILFVATPFAPSIQGFEALPEASKVVASDGGDIGSVGTEQREPVKLTDLPPYVPKAVLAAEDANFYHHHGVDPAAVFRALLRSATGPGQGGSTITQQLAKLNYTGSQHTFARKFKEVLYASRLEKKYSKDQLLERYVNQVYFGDGAYGIAEGARTYFGLEAAQLNPSQAAMLAAKIRAPGALDPYTNADKVIVRRNQVLDSMARHHWISATEREEAKASQLNVVPRAAGGASASSRAPAFLNYVRREADKLGELGATVDQRRQQLSTGGYTVETTLDLKAYDDAVTAAKNVLGAPGDPTTAIASVQPGDGAIRVLFGGLDPKVEFDPASQGHRQPGSSFKPYVYLAALQAGIDPRTPFDTTSPQTLNCKGQPWTVRNYEGEGGGQADVDEAMADSINVVYAQLMAQVGPNAVASAAQSAGIAKDDVTPAECAMALGGLRQGVSPLEQAAAYASFAAKGKYAEPYSIARVRDRSGKIVYDRGTPNTSSSLTAPQVGVLTNALEGVVAHGTGTAAAIGRPLAGKTGTTENYGNAWFIGYVPQLSTAVWVGRMEGDIPMNDVHGIAVTGGTYPARIFSQYMKAALADVPVQNLYTASPDELPLRSTTTQAKPTTTVSTVPPSTAPRPTAPATTLPVTTVPNRSTAPTTPATAPRQTVPGPTPTTAVQSPVTTAKANAGGPNGGGGPGPG